MIDTTLVYRFEASLLSAWGIRRFETELCFISDRLHFCKQAPKREAYLYVNSHRLKWLAMA